MSAMTLEQVRYTLASWLGGSEACLDAPKVAELYAMVSAIDAHLAQNAQGEAVAYAQIEDGKCVALAFTPIADAECQTPLYLRSDRERVSDGWRLAMFILQSSLYAKLPEEERSVCDALVKENPYIADPSHSEGAGEEES